MPTDFIGATFGRWTVIRFDSYAMKGRNRRQVWLCRCTCGTERAVPRLRLVSGGSKSCGCGKTIHGRSRSPEYQSWAAMIKRCTNPRSASYKDYGARGITVCERWRTAANFLADMGPRPGPGYSIERVDHDGNYEPSNCIWADQSTQNLNRRSQNSEFCRNGHAMSEDNRYYRKNGRFACRTCCLASARKYQARRKATREATY